MHADAVLHPVAPDASLHVLSLMPDEPWAVPARAVVAIETATPAGETVFLFGAADHPALLTYLRALAGPVILCAGAPIADQIPRWRPDASARQLAILTLPATGADASFAISPPGGVRRLRPADARRLLPFPPWLWAGYGSPEAMLRHGVTYARYLRAELVAVACTAGTTERYDAIAAFTIERTRRNGFARECARRLIGAIRSERGRFPVLTVGAEDEAAIALARSLGLTARHDHIAYALS